MLPSASRRQEPGAVEDPSISPFDERTEDKQNEDLFLSLASSAGADSAELQGPQPLRAESVTRYQEHKQQELQEKSTLQERPLDIKAEQSKSTASTINLKEAPTREDERRLNQDIYSLIYTANVCSQTFIFAIFVFFLQETLLVLILFDEISFWGGASNRLAIPPGVPVRVNLAQAISMILIISQILGDSGDLPNGLGKLIEGYHKSVQRRNPHATFLKWLAAGALQSLVGITMTAVLFFLCMQATTVVSLCLNFAALSFVMDIDNVTFMIAKEGFLSQKIQRTCQEVESHWVPAFNDRRRKIFKNLLVVSMLVALFVPYALVVHAQWSSEYLCSKIFIQFGDAAIPYLAYYTGPFDLQKSDVDGKIGAALSSRIDSRVYYVDRQTGKLRLAYCEREQAWMISTVEISDHCLYLYKSSFPTNTFDVTTVGSLTWYAWNHELRRAVPVDLYLQCDDCAETPRGNCHGFGGQCIDNECRCFDNRAGRACEHLQPGCTNLRLDTRSTSEFPEEEGFWFSDNYRELRNTTGDGEIVAVHHRPVYIAYYINDGANTTGSFPNFPRGIDIMFFNGYRWVILARDEKYQGPFPLTLYDDDDVGDGRGSRPPQGDPKESFGDVENGLLDVFGGEDEFDTKVLDVVLPLQEVLEIVYQKPIDLANNFYRPFFFSAPVETMGVWDTLDPAGLDWYRAEMPSGHILSQWRPDLSRSLGTIFLCATCNGYSKSCMNSGICNTTTSTCECSKYFSGSLCEQTVTCHEIGVDCENNGNCEIRNDHCTCPGNYFGSLCQYNRTDSLPATGDL